MLIDHRSKWLFGQVTDYINSCKNSKKKQKTGKTSKISFFSVKFLIFKLKYP